MRKNGVDIERDAKYVAEQLFEKKISKATVSTISVLLKTSSTYRILAVRELLRSKGILRDDKTVDFEAIKRFLSNG